ncbi:NH(3)-dependent NAD(+) synthetase [[Clostridium] ultunense Esp]|uniref:NH(3)-dependent NAD(+) synthetase n=1 Tax=[Clostridium] ultunense Esp TaxID=1288971 RepID=M1ZFQ9_9FIRM|nr:NAD(+) synthase [Schnuerera ultunensis]CCQ92542.1 NH(3)-dependent NAD(+) synthetase [[Clostridium] ultunense Esp]SHD77313.1 NH(3)-dependent NAD(+) synthetase [[Clostridium] ultunense Esp]
MENLERVCEDLIEWLKIKVKEAGGKGLVFGLSGGIDSAVVAGLSKKAFPMSSLGIIMPCHSNPIDEEHGLLVAESLDLKTERVDLSKVYDQFIQSVNIKLTNKLALANIKPRLRMTTLYYFAQNYNYLVVGSSNKSEFTIGYFTKHGDSGVDLLPLASFTKTDIWKMARYLNIPEIIIEKPPTAGLWENQTDEDEMGFGYDILDNYIVNNTGPENIVEKIEKMNRTSEHKRKFPPIFYQNINNYSV